MANHQTSATGSSSTGASPNGYYNFDVFINHRGPDTKKTFASHVYRRLLLDRFRVFLDKQEMQAGDDLTCQIKGAIAAASVHIAIFSPKYADSKWCLEELVLMLESGTTIIPVFYHVKPSDLRIKTGKGEDGVYGRALRDLEKKKRYEPYTVEIWRQALSSVSEISGLELEACNGDEGELVDKVVRLVKKKAKKPQLDVTTNPTGLDEKLEDFEWTVLLQQDSGEAKVAGIVGAGGVGKTTLAKQFFNRNRSDYDRCCFLFDVRDAAARNSLTSLQSKLYGDLTGQDQVMNSIDEGIAMLRHHVPHSQALIVLDNVDSVEQLQGLFSPLKDVLSSGSLILFTSRSKNVLTISGIKEPSIYKLSGLSREHSQELFCLHAFHQPYPFAGFEEVVREFLDACQGLPLSLKVIGALLHQESPDIEYWEAQLRKISKVLPMDIQKTLKVSYNNLDEEEKEIFLDIACFFIGEDKDKAIRTWEGSGWEGSIGLLNLENKCLLEVDSENCIRMHDHVRDMGRALAEKEPRRRLWRPTEDIFYNLFYQPYVRGINIDISQLSSNKALDVDNLFAGVRGLQLLRVQGDWCESISNLLRRSNLLWLHWDISSFNRISEHVLEIVSSPDGCSEIFSSPDRCSEIVSSLRHGYSEIVSSSPRFSEISSEGVSSLPVFPKIDSDIVPSSHGCSEVVSSRRHGSSEFVSSSSQGFSENACKVVSDSHYGSSEIASGLRDGHSESCSFHRPCGYSLPSWIPMSNLRVLEIVGCESQLETLWMNDCQAPLQLRELNITMNILRLPKSIGQLKHLEKIQLTYSVKTLPEEFFDLHSLKYLRMRTSMKSLSNALGNLTNLQHLNLTGCHDLQMLPDSFGNLTNLQYVNLNGCSHLETLPHSFGNLIRLKHLCLKSCSMLTLSSGTLGNIRTLQSLDLSACQNMELLPPQVTYQCSLKKLLLWNTNLRELPSAIGNLCNLEILRVSVEESSMEMLPHSLGNLKSLKQLTLFRGKWKSLPDSIGELKQLRDLTIDCGTVEYLPAGVRELNNLEILKVIKCPLRAVPFGSVEYVGGGKDASADQSGRRLLDFPVHKCILLRLKQLDLHGTRIKELSFAEGICPKLRQLDISDCLELVEVGSLPTTLISLDLNGCDALKKVTGFHGLVKLRELDMRKCEAVEELPGLETLISLVHLRVSSCSRLQSIRGLAQATNLQIPCYDVLQRNYIEWNLFEDLRLWKEELHGVQTKNFRRGKRTAVGDRTFQGENELQLEGEDFMGENELLLEAEDLERENELQLEGEDFMGENELLLLLEAEDFEREN